MQASYRCLNDLIASMKKGETLRQALAKVHPLSFLVLGTEWASGRGGLSTFNRKLCIALAELGHEVVLYLSSNAADSGTGKSEEETEAAALGVGLVRTLGKWRDDVPSTINRLQPDFIVGHDRFSGEDAQKLQKQFFPSAQNILFIHTDPAIEMFKGADSTERGRKKEEREAIQRRLMKGADVVAGVGPRLHGHCDDVVAGFKPNERPALVEFIPGFDARDEPPRAETLPRTLSPKVMLIGRAEDAHLKGLDVFRMAIDKLKTERLAARPNVVGALVEEISRLYNDEGFGNDGDVFGYSSDPDRIEEHYRSCYFVVMPSREEGFGLVALEALEANRPVVASDRSGFAQWLLSEFESRAPHLRRAAADCVFTIPDRNYENDDQSALSALAESLAVNLRRLLIDYPGCVENVRMLREVLQPFDWTYRASQFVAKLPRPHRAAGLTTVHGAEQQ